MDHEVKWEYRGFRGVRTGFIPYCGYGILKGEAGMALTPLTKKKPSIKI